MKNITVICPVYNEEQNIRLFFKKIIPIKKKIKNLNILFINDGSKDKSLIFIKEICKKNKNAEFISFNKNYGHQNAILAGLENANSDYYIVMDTDLQHDPKLLPKMIKKIIDTKSDLVQMKKDETRYENFFKSFLSKKFYSFFRKLVNIEIENGSSDFYIINKSLRNKAINSKFGNNFLRGLLHWLSIKKEYISYSPQKRNAGVSKYNFTKQTLFGLTGVVNFFSQFYFFIFLTGISLSIMGIGYIFYILYDFFQNGISVDGWNTIVILVLLFGTAQILISSIQIYTLSRIYNFVGNKPNYIISEFKKTKK